MSCYYSLSYCSIVLAGALGRAEPPFGGLGGLAPPLGGGALGTPRPPDGGGGGGRLGAYLDPAELFATAAITGTIGLLGGA